MSDEQERQSKAHYSFRGGFLDKLMDFAAERYKDSRAEVEARDLVKVPEWGDDDIGNAKERKRLFAYIDSLFEALWKEEQVIKRTEWDPKKREWNRYWTPARTWSIDGIIRAQDAERSGYVRLDANPDDRKKLVVRFKDPLHEAPE